MKAFFRLPSKMTAGLVVFSMSTLFIACDEQQSNNSITPNINTPAEFVTSISGIPFYSTKKLFDKYASATNLQNKENRIAFEKKYKFTSMLSEYETTSNSIDKGSNSLNFYNQVKSQYINKEGFFLVGPVLYQLSNNQSKSIILAGVDTQSVQKGISALLSAKVSDNTAHISVSNVELINVAPRNDKNARRSFNWNVYVQDSPASNDYVYYDQYQTRIEVQCYQNGTPQYTYDYNTCSGYTYDEYGNYQCVPTATETGIYDYTAFLKLTISGLKNGTHADNANYIYSSGTLTLYQEGSAINAGNNSMNVSQNGVTYYSFVRNWNNWTGGAGGQLLEYEASFGATVYYKLNQTQNYYYPRNFSI